MNLTNTRSKNRIVLLISISTLFLLFQISESEAQTFHYLKLPIGNVISINSDPAGNLFIGTEIGIFRSTDLGDNWSRYSLNNTFQAIGCTSMAFLEDTILHVTTNQDGIRYVKDGVWYSKNQGLPKSYNSYPVFKAIAIDSSKTIYAGAIKTIISPPGLYFCKDSVWQELSTGLDTSDVLSIAVSPDGTVYCGTNGTGVYKLSENKWIKAGTGLNNLYIHCLIFDKSGNLFAGTDSGCSVLESGAAEWQNYSVDSGENLPVLGLAIDPTNKNRILASLGHSKYQTGSLFGKIFISQDHGKTWTNASPGLKTLAANAAHITRDGTMFIGAQGTFRSKDKGTTWTAANAGSKDALVSGNGFAINSKDHIFYASGNGVFRSTDYGVTWEMKNNGITRPQLCLLYADSKDNLYAGAYIGHIATTLVARMFRSTNNGESWDSLGISPDDQYCQMAEGPKGTLYCSHGFSSKPNLSEYSPSSLAKSTDYGATWHDVKIAAGMAYGVAVNKRGHVFLGGEITGPYRSTDGGETWDKDCVIPDGGNYVITVSPSDELFTFSYDQYGIWYSDSVTNGRPFVNLKAPGFPEYHSPTCYAWGKNGRMYVGTRSYGAASGIFYTDLPITMNSTFSAVPNFLPTPFNFAWDSKGYLWVSGINFIAQSDSVLGNPKIDEPEIIIDEAQNQDFSIYPVPAKDKLNIEVNSGIRISYIKILTVSGSVVREYDDISEQIYTIDISSLPSGIYSILIATQNGTKSSKISIIK